MTFPFRHLGTAIAAGATAPTVVVGIPTWGAPADAGQVGDSLTYSGLKYFAKAAGNDSLDGLSLANAWATGSKVRSKTGTTGSAAAGSAFFGNRSDVIPGYVNIEFNSAGAYVFDALGVGTRPTLQWSSGDQPSVHFSLFWVNKSGITLRDWKIDGTGSPNSVGGVWLSAGSTGHTVTNVEIANFGAGGIECTADNVTIDGLNLHDCFKPNSNGAGFGGGSCSGFTMRNSTIGDNGSALATQNHQVYMHSLTGALFEKLHLYATSDKGSFAWMTHGTSTNVEFRCGLIDGTGNGLECNSGYSYTQGAEKFTNHKFSRLYIRNCGTLPGQTQGIAMLFGCHQNLLVENVVLWNNNNLGLCLEEGDPANVNFQDDFVNDTVLIQHFLVAGTATNQFSGFFGFSGAPAVSAQKNVTYRNGIAVGRISTSQPLFQKPTQIPNKEVHLRNCCFWIVGDTAGAPTKKVIKWDGVSYTVAEFATYVATYNANPANAANQIDFSGCIQADPKLTFVNSDTGVDPTGVAIDSPCVGAAEASGLGIDFNANPRSRNVIGPWDAA